MLAKETEMSKSGKGPACIVAALALSAGTLVAVGHFTASGMRDGLAMPGAVLAMVGSVVGLYDVPSGPWAAACIAGNFVFYTILWWTVVRVLARRIA